MDTPRGAQLPLLLSLPRPLCVFCHLFQNIPQVGEFFGAMKTFIKNGTGEMQK
jgi:hypothetical protein